MRAFMNIPLGVVLSVISSFLFGLLYYFSTWLAPLSGNSLFGWRMILMLPFLGAFMVREDEWRHVRDLSERLRRNPMLVAGLCVSSALLGVQQWLFLWAPLNNAALEVSLGYFLLPLTMLLVGRFIYQEKLSSLQTIATVMALTGVCHGLFRSGGISWETALVALGFPAYFVLRKELKTNSTGGLWFDNLLIAPVAVVLILSGDNSLTDLVKNPALFYLIPFIGAMSAAAFVCYTSASRLLPFGLFGLLGYVEPMLLFCVSLVVGESLPREQFMTYGPIMLSVLLLVFEGTTNLLRGRNRIA